MKPLETNFEGRGEVKGYHFSLLGMTNRAYLYEVLSGERNHHEVFRRKVNSRYSYISYPTSKGLEIWAWAFSGLKSAIKKYNELNQKK